MMSDRKVSNQLFIGAALLLVGLLLLLNNLEIVNITRIWRWLPTIFILLGLWQIVVNGFRYLTGPSILIVGGLLFQLASFGLLGIDSVWELWPLILILVGGSMLLERSGIRFPAPFGRADDDDSVNVLSIFNGPEVTVTSQAFAGGEATTIFGGIELDLRQAELGQRPVRLNAFAMFGGVEIKVPGDWSVTYDVIGILGGVDDERKQKPESRDGSPDLVVSGFAMFGGIDIVA